MSKKKKTKAERAAGAKKALGMFKGQVAKAEARLAEVRSEGFSDDMTAAEAQEQLDIAEEQLRVSREGLRRCQIKLEKLR